MNQKFIKYYIKMCKAQKLELRKKEETPKKKVRKR